MVLGMHRSGTSAVSLSLRVFGARHGDRLVGGLSSNPRGHWEDIDVLRLNERMFEAIHTRWDSPSPVTPRDVRHLAGKGFVGAAAGLLRDKIAANGFYAVKDPRMTKLLPFWRKAFQAAEIQPYSIIVFRNPASVVASLHKRDKLPPAQGYLLWASHMLECFRHARHLAHLFVNYDEFIENPKKILNAIADHLSLSVNAGEFEMIARDFLDKSLRHTKFDARRLYDDDCCPREIALAYERLERMRREPVNSRPETGNLVRISGMLRSCLRSAGLLTGGAAR
jgi:hypothetical protein